MANFDNKFYNAAEVRNGVTTDPRYNNFPISFPNADNEGATHVHMYPVKRPTLVSLAEAVRKISKKNTYGKSVASLAVGDRIGLFGVSSESDLVSVAWDAISINGFTGNLVLIDEAGLAPVPLAGVRHVRVGLTETVAAGATGVGSTVSKNVLKVDGVFVGATKYVAFEITSLPVDFADCPTIPDIWFNHNEFNHLTSFAQPNIA